jgi:hypothetical protein
VAGGGGDAFVGWLNDQLPRASRITSTGTVAGGWPADGLALSQSAWGDNQIAMASDGEQGALIVWDEGSMPSDDYEVVRVQRLSRTGIWNSAPADAPDPIADSCVTAARPVFQGFRPNPSRRSAATVSFVLPVPGQVSLELFDLTGRRVAGRDMGTLGAGRHTVPLGMGGSAPPGIYFVRMSQAGGSVTARGVLLP